MKSIHRLLSLATATAGMLLLCNCHTTGSTGPTGAPGHSSAGAACCATPCAACCATPGAAKKH